MTEEEERKKFLRRRTTEGFMQETVNRDIIFKRLPQKKQQKLKKKIRLSIIDYSFLQYLPIVFKWVKRNSGIIASDLNMLLYLYPINLFTISQFRKIFMRDLAYSDFFMFARMKGNGWLVKWSESKGTAYYTLSHKAIQLVGSMHKMCMLEKEIPMSERRNPMVISKNYRDQGLMELYKKFNDKVRDKKLKEP